QDGRACCSSHINKEKGTWSRKQDWNGPQTSSTTHSASTPLDLSKKFECLKIPSSIYQLTVALRQMGMCDNGTSVRVLARFFRISEGSVIFKFLTCLSFLIHCNTDFVKKEIYFWARCGKIVSQIGEYTCFKNCIGFINGILSPLEEKPSINPQDYYLRKSSYRIAMLVVCDNKKRILYYLTGWPGFSHDTQLWDNCELHQNKAQLFSPGQYLIGHSGFGMECNLVPNFQKSLLFHPSPQE
ncbi:hypothetical protein VP01_4341g1, partial [Puccinia sorghi]